MIRTSPLITASLKKPGTSRARAGAIDRFHLIGSHEGDGDVEQGVFIKFNHKAVHFKVFPSERKDSTLSFNARRQSL
jgi:hypothetical protein